MTEEPVMGKEGEGFSKTGFGFMKKSRINKCKSSGLGKRSEVSKDRKNAKRSA